MDDEPGHVNPQNENDNADVNPLNQNQNADVNPLNQNQNAGNFPLLQQLLQNAQPLVNGFPEAENMEDSDNEVEEEESDFFSSGETLQADDDDVFMGNEFPNIPQNALVNGYTGQPTGSIHTPESHGSTVTLHAAVDQVRVFPTPDLLFKAKGKGAEGYDNEGYDNKGYEAEDSEISDLTMSIEESAVPVADDQKPVADDQKLVSNIPPEAPEPSVDIERGPSESAPPTTPKDRAKLYLKVGCFSALIAVTSILIIILANEGHIPKEFFIVGCVFSFLSLCVTIGSFIATYHYADLDAKERSEVVRANAAEVQAASVAASEAQAASVAASEAQAASVAASEAQAASVAASEAQAAQEINTAPRAEGSQEQPNNPFIYRAP